jgi:exopolysaccharide biosynthesis predicted pyruvyltransferase EpsI
MRINSIYEYLIDLQRTMGNHPVAYCPNPGNAGDALIAQATFQAFRACGIRYRLVDRLRFVPQGEVVFFGGGGNLCSYYGDARQFIQRVHRSAGKLVLLPHTIERNEDLLGELGPNVDLICREEVSYRHVQHHAKAANVLLADDMAFVLQLDELFQAPLRRPWHRSPLIAKPGLSRRKGRALLAYLRTRALAFSTGQLAAFRVDREATALALPRYNYDISAAFTYGVDNEYAVLVATIHLLRLVRACNRLQTNRLHVAIAGALLGREVRFYANSYYKNRAVYEFSMQARFPNVTFVQ